MEAILYILKDIKYRIYKNIMIRIVVTKRLMMIEMIIDMMIEMMLIVISYL